METPFFDRLNTNYDATDAEYRQVHQIIKEALEQRSRLDDEIARLNAIVKGLRRQQQKIDGYVSGHRPIVSRIRRLPTELVQKIFVWCLPPRNPVMSAKEAPMLLGRICRTWRQISLSCPVLWSSLHLHVTSRLVRNEAQHQVYNDAVQAWLHRSGQVPLSISFAEDDEDWDANDSEVGSPSRLLDTLLQFAFRWRHVNFRLGYAYFESLKRLNAADVPLLETFTFEISRARPQYPVAASLSFLRSPSLRAVSILNFALPMPSALPLRWDTLTKLFFGSTAYGQAHLTFGEAVAILRRCCSLIACTTEITVNGGDGQTLTSRDIITLPYLTHLSMHFTYWENPEQVPEPDVILFFKVVKLPRLRSLNTTGVKMRGCIPITPLLEQRAGEIESLAFDIGDDTADSLAQVFNLLSATKRLHIHANHSPLPWIRNGVSPLNDTTLELLTPTSSTPGTCPCPSLEEVNFRFPRFCNTTDERVLQFIRARTILAYEGFSRLKRASFAFERPFQLDILPDLQPVIKEGVKVQLYYTSDPFEKATPEPLFQPYRSLDIAVQRDIWRAEFESEEEDESRESW